MVITKATLYYTGNLINAIGYHIFLPLYKFECVYVVASKKGEIATRNSNHDQSCHATESLCQRSANSQWLVYDIYAEARCSKLIEK